MTNTFVEDATIRATKYLRSLARRRNDKTVTADDLQRWMNTSQKVALINNERSEVRSRVLRRPNFVATGRVPSKRPESKGRFITAWTINS